MKITVVSPGCALLALLVLATSPACRDELPGPDGEECGLAGAPVYENSLFVDVGTTSDARPAVHLDMQISGACEYHTPVDSVTVVFDPTTSGIEILDNNWIAEPTDRDDQVYLWPDLEVTATVVQEDSSGVRLITFATPTDSAVIECSAVDDRIECS